MLLDRIAVGLLRT